MGETNFVASATSSGDDAYVGCGWCRHDGLLNAQRGHADRLRQSTMAMACYGESDNVARDIEVIVGGSCRGPDHRRQGRQHCSYGGGGIDALYGGGGPDTLYGGDSNDSLDGQEGSDTLYGEGGYDTLLSADGAADELVCGADGGEAPDYESTLDTVSNCDVPL